MERMIKIWISVYSNIQKHSKNLFSVLLFCVFCATSLQAQLRSELNLPRSGDRLQKEQIDYFNPGEAGENQIWDFNKLQLIDKDYAVTYFTREDWKIIGSENGMLSFFSVTGDSLLLSGYENYYTLVCYQQPGLLMRFPLAYGASSKSRFSGRGIHHGLFESILSGEINTLADATGTLILPGGDTLSNTIRIHVRKVENARFIPLSSGFTFDQSADEGLFRDNEPNEIITEISQWYEDGFRYPVLESVEEYCNVSGEKVIINRHAVLYHPARQTAHLPDDPANREALERKEEARKSAMQEKESNILSFRCYPNPVKEQLSVELSFRQAAAVEVGIWDIYGFLIKHIPPKTNDTNYRETVDIGAFPNGYYLIKVTTGSETASETVLKN